MNTLYKKTVLSLAIALFAMPFMNAEETIMSDACIEAFLPCVEAINPAKPVNQQSSSLSSYWNTLKGYVQNIDTAKIQASVKDFGTSCLQAVKKDPKQAGMYAAVVVISSYIIYKLLKKGLRKTK